MTPEELAAAGPDPSVPPPATLDGDVRAADWLGLDWQWIDVAPPVLGDTGVYRIGERGDGPLDYLGQGLIATRVKSHAKNWAVDLAAERDGETVWDWVSLRISPHQLLEVENDLIAGHMVTFKTLPLVQVGGSI